MKRRWQMRLIQLGLVLPLGLALASSAQFLTAAPAPAINGEIPLETLKSKWMPVSGTGIHFFSSAVVHSVEPTETGFIQQSTETVDLTGDLVGRLLYQPTSVFDFAEGTLVNTGHQVFSGTVLGSAPVLLHDDQFRFEVDLKTGETLGVVYLVHGIAGPRTRCLLDVVGTGLTPEGDATFDYSGECKLGAAQR
jgi:hypothetical protein